ncbi:hypothetical protein BH11VER1_BH11VER1_01400 [soil metagenome]
MKLPLFFCTSGFLVLSLLSAAASEIITVRLPEGALQPRTVSIADGSTAVVFLQGNPQASEVKLATLSSAGKLDAVTTLNTPATQAVAMGTVRGPSIAVGAQGVRHVLWHGKNGSAGGGKGSALFYTKAEVSRKISPPLDMLGTTTALDGGAAIAANVQGEVWIVWHALPVGKEGETERRVFVRHSSDNGATFSEPWAIKGEDQGVCGCCGLAASTDATGALYVLYRTAEQTKQRGARFLRLPPKATGDTAPVLLQQDRWDLKACPMTTAALLPDSGSVEAFWITDFKLQIFGQGLESIAPSSLKSTAMRNHPRLARKANGETLLIWTEGAMWGKGGELIAQFFSANGKPTGEPLKQPLPTWSYGACATLPDGRFVVLY